MIEKYNMIRMLAATVAKRYKCDFDECFTHGIEALEMDIWDLPPQKTSGRVYDFICDQVAPKEIIEDRIYQGDVERELQSGLTEQEVYKKFRIGYDEFLALKDGKQPHITKYRSVRRVKSWNEVAYNEDLDTFEDEHSLDSFFDIIDKFGLTEQEESLCLIVLSKYGFDINTDKEEAYTFLKLRGDGHFEKVLSQTEHKIRMKSPFRVPRDSD